MADIKQASKWMLEGKAITREGWHDIPLVPSHCHRVDSGRIVWNHSLASVDVRFECDDLLADDWEIAE